MIGLKRKHERVDRNRQRADKFFKHNQLTDISKKEKIILFQKFRENTPGSVYRSLDGFYSASHVASLPGSCNFFLGPYRSLVTGRDNVLATMIVGQWVMCDLVILIG